MSQDYSGPVDLFALPCLSFTSIPCCSHMIDHVINYLCDVNIAAGSAGILAHSTVR